MCLHLPVSLAEFSQLGACRTHFKTKRGIHWWQVTLLISWKSQSGFVSVTSQLLGFLRQHFETHGGKGKLQSNGWQWLEYIFLLKKYIIHRFIVTLISPKRALSIFKGERSCKNFFKSLSSKICWQRILLSVSLSALGTEIFPVVLHFKCPRIVFLPWMWQRGLTGCPVPHVEIMT